MPSTMPNFTVNPALYSNLPMPSSGTGDMNARNFQQEISQIPQLSTQLLGANLGNLVNYQNAYTRLNAGNYDTALYGAQGFDANAFLAATPDLQRNWDSDPGYKDVYGTIENYAQSHYNAWGNNDPRYITRQGGAVQMARGGFDAANPALTAYNNDLQGTMNRLNGTAPLSMTPTGYSAATAGAPGLGAAPQTRVATGRATTANAATAAAATGNLSRVGQSMLAPSLSGDALNYGQVSPLQLELNRQALRDLSANGPTSGELADAGQAARAAYSDRGMVRSNRAVGAEILATDDLRRARRNEARQFAAGVDQQGFSQRQGNRSFALQAGEFLQAPDYFNAGAANDMSRFNAGTVNDMSRFNVGSLNDMSRFNAGARNDMSQFNASARNQVGLANTALTGQYDLTRYGTEADLNRFNATNVNDASRFNATASNDASRFNTGLAYQQQADQWGRSMDYGNFLRGQAVDPSALAATFAGSTPDYTGSLMQYGQDVYNTNVNAQATRDAARSNGKAAMTGSIIGGVATIGGAALIAF